MGYEPRVVLLYEAVQVLVELTALGVPLLLVVVPSLRGTPTSACSGGRFSQAVRRVGAGETAGRTCLRACASVLPMSAV